MWQGSPCTHCQQHPFLRLDNRWLCVAILVRQPWTQDNFVPISIWYNSVWHLQFICSKNMAIHCLPILYWILSSWCCQHFCSCNRNGRPKIPVNFRNSDLVLLHCSSSDHDTKSIFLAKLEKLRVVLLIAFPHAAFNMEVCSIRAIL